jgi:thiol:disulfide interchange protein DsbD
MNHNEEDLIIPVGYTPNVNEYYNWLKEGVSKY